ncbi:MAG: site-specific integrase [Sulfitobacter sp.]
MRSSQVFGSKQAARDWAAREEYLILNAKPERQTAVFGDVLGRYAREVSPKKRGARWEILRIERFRLDAIARVLMADLTATDFSAWRDARLHEVAPATVNREMVLLSAVLSVARKEWRLIALNPISDVRKPTKPPARDRLVSDTEFERLEVAAGSDLTKQKARAFHAFRFSIETAMRAGEVVGLEWSRVDLGKRVARLAMTKNGTAREVPLSSEAVRLLEALPRLDPVFGLTSANLDALWRRLRDRAGVVDLTYHDSRHVAITRLARKLDVLPLARMVGHKDLRMLQTYYNESAEELAKLLD